MKNDRILKVGVTCLQLVVLIIMSNMVMAQPTAAWLFQFNGQGDYSDRYTCITADGAGNIYTGGSTVNIGVDRDFLIQKTDASGNVIWRTIYNAPGNGPDEVQAIVVDASQNVYVTGFGKNADVGYDFLTMKLDANGNILWEEFYNYDVANGYDQGNSIVLDGNGNVIVTGQSDEDASAITNDDYLTIKYSNDGAQLWIVRYNGVGNGIDRAVKVVVDNANNIYITGRSFNGNDDDYATIKYNSDGTQQWLKYGDRTHNDRAQAMAIDGNSNIYVTGWSSNGTNKDYFTIKYNSSGTQQWAKVFDFFDDDIANAIFVDAAGSVYVTGQSDGDATPFVNYNYRTIKYGSNGTQQWSSTFDGSAGNDDIPTAIFVSGSNVYVTGYSDADATLVVSNNIITIEYSSSGSQTWASTFAGNGGHDDVANALYVDGSGNSFVAGYEEDNDIQRNALLVKYDGSGSQLFEKSFNGVGDNSDNVRDLKIDQQGNLIVAGYAVQRGDNRDFFTIKLNTQGDTLWTKYINGSSPDSEDEADACDVTTNGNILVSGFTKNSGTSGDYTLVELDNTVGDSLWLRYYDSPVHEYDKSYDMKESAAGNIYLTGRSDSDPSINSNDDATTIMYNNTANLIWASTYAGAANGPDRGSFLCLAPTGNVYVVGRTYNGSNNDMLIIKYNNNGVQQWAKTYDGGAGNEDPKGMVLDINENVYLVGNSASAGGDTSDILLLKYSASGDFQWERRINHGGGDLGTGITLDQFMNVIITGTTDDDNSPAVNLNTFTIKYDGSGNEVWSHTFDNNNHLDDVADAITSDQFGNSYVALHSNFGTATDLNFDIVLVRYNADGSEEWQTSWGGASDTLDAANLLYLVNNDLYVGGSTWETGQQRDILVIKYSTVTGVNEIDNAGETVSILPNPFTDFLNITTGEPSSEKQVELFDVTGRMVFSQSFSGNKISLPVSRNLPSGMYLCNILLNNKIIHSEKIICEH